MPSLFFIAAAAGCGGGGGGGGGGNTTLEGTIALNNGQSGTVTLNVSGATLAKNSKFSILRQAEAQTGGNVTGNCVTPTCPSPGIPLSGNFNTSTNTFSVSGSSSNSGCPQGNVTFNGNYTPGTGTNSGSMSGTITSTQNGTTTTIGGFNGFNTSNTPGTTSLCGTFNGSAGGSDPTDIGVFDVTINGSSLSGTAQDTCAGKNPVTLNAAITGNTFSGCSNDSNGSKPFCGTISADGQSLTGFFQKGDGTIGCFTGSTSFCSATTPPSCSSPPPCGTQNCTFQTCQ
ncbi:MAG: hypothetical protein U1F57_01775 [bacterium]